MILTLITLLLLIFSIYIESLYYILLIKEYSIK